MAIKNFRLQLIIRVAGIFISTAAAVYLWFETPYLLTSIIFTVILIIQVIFLIRFTEKINRDLDRFMTAFRYQDYGQTFAEGNFGKSFDEVYRSFNIILSEIRDQRSEKEEALKYLKTVVGHLRTGLISFRQDGSVDLINRAAKRLLGIGEIRTIDKINTTKPLLYHAFLDIEAGQRLLVKSDDEAGEAEFSVFASEFSLRGSKYKLVTFQNIHSELEDKEQEAWQKLIRVLTHEIMNSITPVSSLSSAVYEMLHEKINSSDKVMMDGESLKDCVDAIGTINKRSKSLIDFVKSYRSLTIIPKPVFRQVSLYELLLRTEILLENEMKELNIGFKLSIEPKSISLKADQGLIEQVLINLMLNSMDAVAGKEDSQIALRAYSEAGRIKIEVSDNGRGIVKDAIGKIFIPFYTTKKGGSGIGLSLSRSIMKMHGGNIKVKSEPDVGTVFILNFPSG